MKFSWSLAALATLLAACVLAGGCGGLSAAPSFSPMMLLVPGLGKNDRPTPPAIEPAAPEDRELKPAQAG